MTQIKDVKLEDIIDLISEQIVPEPKDDFLYVGLEHISSGDIRLKDYASSQMVRSSKFKFAPADILYGKLRPYLDKVVLADKPGICSTDIIVLRPRTNLLGKYLIYLFHTLKFVNYANGTTTGMNLPRTSWKKIKDFAFPIPFKSGKPDLEEQKRIADKIDKLFAGVDKGVITTGDSLSESHKILQSELRNIFDIANQSADWQLLEMGNITEKMRAGGTPKTSIKQYWGGEIPFVKISDITASKKYLDRTSQTITEEGLRDSSTWLVPKNSLILSMYGTVGRVVINKIPVAITQNMSGIVPDKDNILLDYLFYVLKYVENTTLKDYLKLSVHQHFGITEARRIRIPIPINNGKPDLNKQREIIKKLESIQDSEQSLTSQYVNQINLFGLLRQSTLNNAFAGKL